MLCAALSSAGGFDGDSVTWRALSRAALLCNRAEFKPGQESVPIMKRLDNFSATFLSTQQGNATAVMHCNTNRNSNMNKMF